MIKNIIAVLSIILLIALAYYLFFMGDDMDLDFAADASVSAQLLQNTQTFVERQRTLQRVQLDTQLFQDERFIRLMSYEVETPNIPVGKSRLFDPLVPVSNITPTDTSSEIIDSSS